jgi:uncharacterized surface protein with fasciclin (FAS1) repeats
MRTKVTNVIVIGAALFLLPSLVMAGSYGQKAVKMDIVDTAVSAGSFTTLVTALKAADLDGVLRQDGPYTVFAPTDAAFAKIPAETLNDLLRPENKAKLQAILTYHVVPGRYGAKDVVGMSDAKTANGQAFAITSRDGKVMVDNAQVLETDIMAANGIIHVIDTVIMPQ